MTVLAFDASNYSSGLTPEALAAAKLDGVGLAIIQAIDPPAGFPAGVTRQQIQACLDAGLPVDAYVYLWFDADISDIQHKLSLLDGLPIRRLWLDVEDTAAAKYDQATCENKVADALAECDRWVDGAGITYVSTGVYTGRWMWSDPWYMANASLFSGRDLWDSDYDNAPDPVTGFTPYGGWTSCAIKQYAGTSNRWGIDAIDLNVLSDEEAAKLTTPTDSSDPCAPITSERDGLVSAFGYVGGDLLAPVAKLKLTSQPKAVQALVAGLRGVCDQHGINHA